MATFSDPTFDEIRYTPIFTQEIGKLEIQHIDYFASNVPRALQSITLSTPYVYRGYEHITTIAYAFHGTTATWRHILDFNGLVHALDIPPGTIIQIPDFNQLTEALSVLSRIRSESNEIGQTEEI